MGFVPATLTLADGRRYGILLDCAVDEAAEVAAWHGATVETGLAAGIDVAKIRVNAQILAGLIADLDVPTSEPGARPPTGLAS
jgi:hypothetical protein